MKVTYERTVLPMDGGYTVVDRMLKGKQVIVHGDGSSLWTLTHHADFAKGFVGLLGNSRAIGEAVHITSDEWLSWNQIFEIVAHAFGATAKIVHVPSDLLAAYDPNWGAGLLGDKTHSLIFDNSKIKAFVPGFQATIPFREGIRRTLAWFAADNKRQRIDDAVNAEMDAILKAYAEATTG